MCKGNVIDIRGGLTSCGCEYVVSWKCFQQFICNKSSRVLVRSPSIDMERFERRAVIRRLSPKGSSAKDGHAADTAASRPPAKKWMVNFKRGRESMEGRVAHPRGSSHDALKYRESLWTSSALEPFRKRHPFTARCSNSPMSSDSYAIMNYLEYRHKTMKLCTHNHKTVTVFLAFPHST